MQPLILIPSRLSATRLPNKPLADIAGAPMIVHVWRQAMASKVGRVVVAADDAQIVAAIEAEGGEAVLTRTDHPSGSDRIFEALQKVDPDGNHGIIINLQGDMPTIDPRVIAQVLEPLKNPDVAIATLAAEIHTQEETDDNAVVKPVLAFSSPTIARALYFTRLTAPWGEGARYHHIGIYAYRREALMKFVALPPSSLELREKLEQLRALEAGMRVDVAIVDTVPLGVDTPAHLEKARALFERHNG